MALVAFGNGVADIRGSIGGTTFARNPHGAYARNRTTPVQPNTMKQSQARAAFGMVPIHWSSVLSTAQRDAWEAMASTLTFTNRLGQTYTPNGQELHNKYNCALAPLVAAGVQNGETGTEFVLQAACPTAPIKSNPGFALAHVAGPPKKLTITAESEVVGAYELKVYVSAGLKPTVTFWNGPYETTLFAEGAAAGVAVDILSGVTSGDRHFVKASIIGMAAAEFTTGISTDWYGYIDVP